MTPGTLAPPLSCTDETGREWWLPVLGGWTWLWFGPQFVPHGCRSCEASQLHELYPDLRVAGVMPFGVTFDDAEVRRRRNDPFPWRVPLLWASDEQAAAYGALRPPGDPWAGLAPAARSVLVDPDGRVFRVWNRPDPRTHAAEVLAAVA